MTSHEVLVGILGGVGPAAGVLLHQTLLQHTASGGVDQGHLPVCHLSQSADVASRVLFLQAVEAEQRERQQQRQQQQEQQPRELQDDEDSDIIAADRTVVRGMENPAVGMARTFAMLRALRVPVVAGVPCVTFHAAPIWREFRRLIAQQHCNARGDSNSYDAAADDVRCVDMLEETVRLLAEVAPRAVKVGVMATTGTRGARVFHDLLEPRGYELLEVSPQTQDELQDTIQNPHWGLKSTAPNTHPRCVANFERYARELLARGADVLVLGCTEIPFAFGGAMVFEGVPLVDPLVALARALIREADPRRLKPLVMMHQKL